MWATKFADSSAYESRKVGILCGFLPLKLISNEVYTMKKGHVVKCDKCGKNYYYESTGNPWPGGKDRETAYCPYCKAEGPFEIISGVIYTYKLDDNGNPIR